jgi:PII-like signaling protein
MRNQPATSEKSLDSGQDAVLLRIYIGDGDKHGHLPLYEAIVLKAREMHLAGATVLRSAMGYGSTSKLHTAKILQLSTDLPIVIEIVDLKEKIDLFLPVLETMMQGGLVTLETVQVLHYQPHKNKGAA